MAWKSISILGQRWRFVKSALKARKTIIELCQFFKISRKTGYKWIARFRQNGRRGLRDQSRRPRHSPAQIRRVWMERIRYLRRHYDQWGGKKIRATLCGQYRPREVPCVRTITNCLRRLKLSRVRRRRPRKGPLVQRKVLTVARRSNHVWTVDFKGWFCTADGKRMDPLTVRDMFSRYLLTVRLLPDQSWWRVRKVFVVLIGRYGCPKVIRVDNGGPFGSTGAGGLSRLSAWWTSLGIRVEFIAPGHPEQNGAHEQMHRVLKSETTRPPSRNRRAQQRRINQWVKTYNRIRPHEALGQRTPAEAYHPQGGGRNCKPRKLEYARSWATRQVRQNGEIRWRGRNRFVGEAFVGHRVGLRAVDDGIVAVHFAKMLIGELREADVGAMRPAVYLRPRSSN
jgi:transposase InsO family protein